MVQQQDSEHPEGVNGPDQHGMHGNSVHRARGRKANAALAMALAGATQTEIAQALGYPTARTARIAVERALEKELTTSDREKLRKLAGARLDRLLRSVWPKAITDNPDQMVAVGRARELLADHRKLFGLDAPTEVVVHSPTQAELEAWVARVTAVTLPQVPEYDVIDGDWEEGPDALPAGER